MSIQAQQYPVFQPAMRIITDITNANPASVTTSFPHQYKTGMIVRIILPLGYGMEEINQKFSDITVTGSTTFNINIDTTFFRVFTIPSTAPENLQYAQAIPTGEVNFTVYLATKNVLPYGAV